jgi:hypothetical protein
MERKMGDMQNQNTNVNRPKTDRDVPGKNPQQAEPGKTQNDRNKRI